ncbi:metallophosphoesterase family protein [Fodinibius sp.]|uniref:metallophosphoesterase family protein n=1 Tax=Fodinibius sp. TaxID=1872440 RepID=UPI002ACD638A|nr:metallophosphoesterase family protein [Fodinibius sp.]MDZ7660125.1 metallophosphoesterase family protein [Fodinibius sp.]
MSEQKYIAVGDIHGCFHSMKALLEKLEPFYDRQFVFVGDYIDRGPGSKQIIDYLLEFKERVDCVFLRGNHEQMLLDAIHHNKKDLWLMNGGRATIESYEPERGEIKLPDSHMEFYENTRLYYDTEKYFFVHAGLSPARTIADSIKDENEVQEFLWERSHLNAFETPWEKTVVFGHTPRPKPIQKENMIGIDTGCVFDRVGYGKLTAVKLPEEEFLQQTAID